MSRAEKLSQYKEQRKTPKGPIKRLYTIPEAAHYLGRTVDGLRELIWAGKISYIKVGWRVFLDVKDMDEHIEQNKMRFTY
jgi:excisionase family DNA binding protein